MASGNSIGNASEARTLTLSGGTLTLEPPPAGPAEGSSLWLNANDTSKMTFGSGNAITAWASSSGTEGTVTGNGTYTPNVINGQAVVRFNTSEYMSNNVDLSSSACTIFAVERFYDGDNHNRIVSSHNNNWLLGAWGGELDRFYFEGWVTESGISADTNPHMYEATIGGSGQNSTVYVYDSRNLSSVQPIASNQNGTTGPNGLQLNGSGVWGELSNADVAEVLIYNGVLTAEQRAQTEAYLAYKYWGTVLEGGGVPGDFTTTSIGVTASSNLALPEGARLGKLTLSNNAVLTLSPVTSASFAGLAGTGSVAGVVTIAGGGKVSPGTDSTISVLSAAGLTLEGGSLLTFNITGAGTLDRVNVTGTGGLTILGGGITLLDGDGTDPFSTPGTYNLINYVGTLGGNVSNLAVVNKVVGKKYTFTADAGFVTLAIADGGFWNGGAGTVNWSDTANWNGIAPGPNDTLVFSTAGAGGATLNNNIGSGPFASLQFESTAPAFTLNGNSITLNGDGLDKVIIVNNSTAKQTVNLDITLGNNGKINAAAGDVAVGGNISGGFSLTKTGPGTLTISGANNTYNGGTIINGGAVVIDNTSTTTTLGAAGKNLTLGGGSLNLGGSSQTVGALSVTAAGTISNGSLTGTSYNISNPSGEVIISANLLVNGGAGLTKSGDGTATLSGNNTYTGLTDISAGTLKLGSSGALPQGTDKGDVTVDGALDLNGFSPTINGFSGAGTVTNGNAAAATLTVGDGDKDGSFSGMIKNGSGTAALAKIGTGTLTLSGASTYSGGTTVSAGTLVLGNRTALGTGTVTLAGDTNFRTVGFEGNGAYGAVSNPIVLSGGNVNMRVNFGDDKDIWLSGAISGSGGINVSGDGRGVTLTGDNSFAGGVVMQNTAVRLQIGHQNALGTGTLTWEQTNADWIGLAAVADLRGNETYPNGVPNNVVIAENGIFGVYGDESMELSGVISGDTGSLMKRNNGTLVLSGENTYRGGTTVVHGTLTINGSLADSTMTIKTAPPTWPAGGAPGVVNGSGTLTFNIAGADCDLIQVINGGTLNITNLNIDISAAAGDLTELSYVLVDWAVDTAAPGNLIGAAFASESLPFGWKLDYNLEESQILLLPGQVGDTNLDGVVDAVDFMTLKKNFGATIGGGMTVGDFDNSGTVDWDDLNTLTSNFGAGSGGASAMTPEPATLGLLMVGALAVIRRRRK